ncbi:hypothetical protein ABS71_08970 [bacterium SCN 62-11]|nr:hypothetical protein [Candidatus Eremiobacteraeota bacterium]ODT69559.1 MAG: hypothetical protein ABS71_08970 [bacterium SCN 62-11]
MPPQPPAIFSKFLHYRVFDFEGQQVGILNGPGHDCAAVAAVVLDPQSRPYIVLKTGDARMARVVRNDTYLKWGCISGRMDKAGANASKIALAEITEEVGGHVVEGSFRPVGQWLTPTQPYESSECDANFFSLIQIGEAPKGDGGGMEVEGLIGPLFLKFQDGFAAMEDGRVGDAGRAMTLYRRCADWMGYVPELDRWVYDHPRLQQRYSTLGLGESFDPRKQGQSEAVPANFVPNGPAAAIDGAAWTECQKVPLSSHSQMLDGKTQHTAHGVPQGPAFTNQLMQSDYDRAKVVAYTVDPERGPLVRLSQNPRPIAVLKQTLSSEHQADRQENHELLQLDVDDIQFPRGGSPQDLYDTPLQKLGEPCGASSGQSDIYYHFYARQTKRAPEMIPIAQAIQQCRTGQGDAQTEALLLRLCRHLHWLPTLDLTVEQAQQML